MPRVVVSLFTLSLAASVQCTFASSSPICSTAFDCQLNGECSNGVCICDAAWTGPQCGVLDVEQGTVAYGNGAATSPLTSSWGGGPPVADANGLYHLFVSEIAAHCGMSTWARMSFAAHTVSSSPVGPFTRLAGEAGIAIGTFVHNTFYVRAGGLHLLYHIGDGQNNASCNPYWTCSNGTTPGGHGLRPPSPWPAGSCPPSNGGTQVHYSTSLAGPWLSFGPVTLGPGGPGGISNPAPLVLANGTVYLMGRTKDSVAPPIAAHNIWLFRAPQWNATYEFVNGTGVDGSVGVGNGIEFTEDPVLWEGRRGFHAMFHSQANVSHGWSMDLLHWGWDHNSACAACIDPDGSVIIDHERPRVVLDTNGDIDIFFTSSLPQDSGLHGDDHSRLLAFRAKNR
jgi:hypothetical protein